MATNDKALITMHETMPEWMAPIVKDYADPERFDLILPAVPINAELGFGYRPSISVVQINPDPAEGEVFKVGSVYTGKDSGGKSTFEDRFAYAKPALLKMAMAAGISINTTRVDRGDDHDYCEMKAIAMMKNESGSPVIRTATKAFYMPDVASEALRNREKKNAKANPQYRLNAADLEAEHRAEMTAFRKHLLRRTEAGAITAAIRDLLAIKGALTAAQVRKPKVLLRVDFRPDHHDPIVKRFLLEQAGNATFTLYGMGSSPPANGPGMRTLGPASVIEEAPDDETEQARASHAAALTSGTATPSTDPEAAPTRSEILVDFEEGCGILGLDLIEKSAVLQKYDNDPAKALAEVNRMVTARDAAK